MKKIKPPAEEHCRMLVFQNRDNLRALHAWEAKNPPAVQPDAHLSADAGSAAGPGGRGSREALPDSDFEVRAPVPPSCPLDEGVASVGESSSLNRSLNHDPAYESRHYDDSSFEAEHGPHAPEWGPGSGMTTTRPTRVRAPLGVTTQRHPMGLWTLLKTSPRSTSSGLGWLSRSFDARLQDLAGCRGARYRGNSSEPDGLCAAARRTC
ncbi:hypothetical protein BD413DRAFT_307792 [Trametes elegans]|nr:hypothetical protein BD413DRAFT_307792 [Trametes elegans]